MENSQVALQKKTEKTNMSIRRESRGDNVAWSLKPSHKQLVQILAQHERLSVSELVFRCFTKGLKLVIEEKPVFDPNETPEDIMDQFDKIVKAEGSKYERARQSVIAETITRTDLTPLPGDEVVIEIRE